MQVVDRYGCRTGTFFVLGQPNTSTALKIEGGPFISEEAATSALDRFMRDGARHLFIVEVKKHLQVAVQLAEVVNG